jgi:hypothetical protein
LKPIHVSELGLPDFCLTPRLRLSSRSSENTVVLVSRAGDAQNSWPAVAGFSAPSAPVVLTMFRSPLTSGFAAVAEFGLAM